MSQRTIENTSKSDVTTFDILTGKVGKLNVVNGFQLLSMQITKEANKIPFAKIVLRDGDSAKETFDTSDTDDFIPGKQIQIKIGRDGNNTLLFKGIIVSHAIKIRENGNSELTIECKDECIRMSIGRHSHYYSKSNEKQGIKDSEIFEQVINRYEEFGLSGDIETTICTHKKMVQHHISDWDFLLLRAEANGRLIIANDGVLKIKHPDTTQEPTLTLLNGSTMFEFEAEMDAKLQLKSVQANAWDYTNQRLFNVKTSSIEFQEQGNLGSKDIAVLQKNLELRHSGQLLEQELTEWTKACLLKSRLAKIRGRAKIMGYAKIKVGDMVGLHGVGERFNGKAFVSAIRHEIGSGSWYTHIQFGLSPEWFSQTPNITEMGSSGLTSSINGLQVGKVVQLQDDPNGEDRVLVKIPTLDNNSSGIWARMASLDAGKNRGAFFRPEIDDEVIIGFVNDDPREPIILGMLHSRANQAPIPSKDTNHIKGFTTRSKMRLEFDDQHKTITIDTPQGNKIVIDEQSKSINITDQNQNFIKLGSTGIEINSASNLTLKAAALINIAAGTGFTMGGTSVSVKADGPIELKGATAKISSPGITEITGSLVKIN
jgi:Rhs element Vgr protein